MTARRLRRLLRIADALVAKHDGNAWCLYAVIARQCLRDMTPRRSEACLLADLDAWLDEMHWNAKHATPQENVG